MLELVQLPYNSHLVTATFEPRFEFVHLLSVALDAQKFGSVLGKQTMAVLQRHLYKSYTQHPYR
jgi:hypothetical protein